MQPSLFAKQSTKNTYEPTTHTVTPYVTGSSVLAIKYKDGVVMTADTLVSYGSLAKYRSVQRMMKFGDRILIGASGDYSDFQEITRLMNEKINEEEIQEDGHVISPAAMHSHLARLMYYRRNKFDPLWNILVVAGFKDGQAFLGSVDLQGTNFEDNTIATGYGSYIAQPLLRRSYRPDMSFEEARQLLLKCMEVLYYRDARTYNRLQLANVNADGVVISDPFELPTDWSLGNIVYEDDVKPLALNVNF